MDKIKTVLFCGALAVFFLIFLFLPKEDYSDTERRYLSDAPVFSANALFKGDFTEYFEKYFADHFPFRTFFVGAYHNSELLLGNNGESGVYKGKDGFLFTVPESDVSRLGSNLKAIDTFCQTNKLSADMMIVPSAGAVLTPWLPKNHLTYKEQEQVTDATATLSEAVHIIDLYPVFNNAPEKQTLYFHTDHHWTDKGAYLGYRTYAEEKGWEHLTENAYKKTTYHGFYGTSYAKSGLWQTKGDSLVTWESPNRVSVTISDDNGKEEISDSCFFPEAFQGQDPYNIYFNGNHSLIHIRTENAPAGKILLIKDSYANAFAPLLTEQYRDIFMIDLRYFRKEAPSELIKREDIENILFLYSFSQLATDQNFLWLK